MTRTSGLRLLEQVVALLASEPTLSANEVVDRLGVRRQDALRAVRAVRSLEAVHRSARGPDRPENRFPSRPTADQREKS